jgi:uncharacterized protein YPO0396
MIMVVMTPREKWTDERLDDLNLKVDRGFAETKAEMHEGFARVDGEIKDLRREMDARFDKVDARFDQVNARLDKITDRFLDQNRVLIGGTLAIIATLIGGQVFG